MLKIAHQQGIDITALARQYPDLPADRVQRIVDEIKGQTNRITATRMLVRLK